MKTKSLIPVEIIENRILLIRGRKVILDSDLAQLYGVTTKRLNEQVKRNKDRFPTEFMFRLNKKEKAKVVANCDHLAKLKFSTTLPYAFTEHGAIMLASVLNSKKAIEASIFIVLVFVRIREILSSHREIAIKFKELEQRLDTQDSHIKVIMSTLNEMLEPPEPPKKEFGFKVSEKHYPYKTKRS